MTLIAFAAHTDSADMLTDTTSYTPTGSSMGHCTKARPLVHLDTVVLTQGDAGFGRGAVSVIEAMAENAPDLDALVQGLRAAACAAWLAVVGDRVATTVDSTIFLVGYSPAAETFRAYGFASENDFAPWQIHGLHVMPSPFTMRPSDLELNRHEADGVAQSDAIAAFRAKPAPAAPRDAAGWVELGTLVREHRFGASVASGFKTVVAGSLIHTRLTRGHVTTDRVHTFDDHGEEFQRMIAGTYHPQAQFGSCWCDSGYTWLDCHGAAHANEDCMCGSGQLFGTCCSLATQAPAAVS